MNYTLFFFIFASATLILSIVAICVAPIINGFLSYYDHQNYNGDDFGLLNCNYLSDMYDYWKKEYNNPNEVQKKELKRMKKEINRCKRGKTMHGLEFASLNTEVAFGAICAILGLLHYLEVGKTIEKKTGLIGVITGTIGFIITLIYVIFSAYVFNNDNNRVPKLFPNGAYLKNNGYKFVPPYDLDKFEEDSDVQYATYSELGQKQYNYDSDIFKNYIKDTNVYRRCTDGHIVDQSQCDYLWKDLPFKTDIELKYIYDRWLTTIVLSVFIVICNIGLILFGFFLFKNLDESSGGIPVPISSVNALDNK